MSSILKTLIDDKESEEFRAPVNYVMYGLEDYLELIKKPMDLGTLK